MPDNPSQSLSTTSENTLNQRLKRCLGNSLPLHGSRFKKVNSGISFVEMKKAGVAKAGWERKVIGLAAAFAILFLALLLVIYYQMAFTRQALLQSANTMQSNAANRVLFVVPTWTKHNGLSAMDWNAVTEVDVFDVTFDTQGAITYDGGFTPATQQIITTAHRNGATVTLGVGGSSMNDTIISTVLSNGTLRQALINNLISEVQLRGYDGIQVDFEGCFDSKAFPSFIQGLYDAGKAINSSFFIVLSVADWEQAGHACSTNDFNVTLLAPYVKYFDVMFNESTSGLANWTAEVGGNASKISMGYDLAPADDTYYVPTLSDLKADKSSNHSLYFYSAEYAPTSLYSMIIQAGYGNAAASPTTTAPTASIGS